MGKLQKISTEKSPSIFDAIFTKHQSLKDREPEMKSARVEPERDRSWATLNPAPKLQHNDFEEIDLVRGAHSIRSARCGEGGISNNGGSGRFVGANKDSSMTSKSLDGVKEQMTSKEATAEEKKSAAAVRSLREAEYRQAQSPRIGDDYVPANGSAISKSNGNMNSRYYIGAGKMSIFDNADFERLQDLPGEKMEKRVVSKDNSWQEVKKNQTLQDADGKLFDNLTAESQKSGYKSIQQQSVNRIFDAMMKGKESK